MTNEITGFSRSDQWNSWISLFVTYQYNFTTRQDFRYRQLFLVKSLQTNLQKKYFCCLHNLNFLSEIISFLQISYFKCSLLCQIISTNYANNIHRTPLYLNVTFIWDNLCGRNKECRIRVPCHVFSTVSCHAFSRVGKCFSEIEKVDRTNLRIIIKTKIIFKERKKNRYENAESG